MLYKFELGHNIVEATKKICCAKGEGAVDHSKVARWFKKFYLGCKNFDDQAKSSKPKTVDSEAMLQVIETRFGLVSLFNGISTFVGYLMPKPLS